MPMPARLAAQQGAQSTEDSAVVRLSDSAIVAGDEATIDRIAIETVRRRFDSSVVTPLVITHASVDRYRQLDEFDYDRVRDPRSLWDRVVEWAMRWLQDLLPGSAATFFDHFLRNWLPWILILGALALIGLKLYRTRLGGVLGRSDTGVSGDMMRTEDDARGVDLERAAQDAVDAGRYRLAIRYFYLATLRDLADRGLIDFKSERTNTDYLRDLARSPFRESFERVMLLFEYTWYGELPVDADRFASMRQAYSRLRSELHGRSG